MTVYLCHRHLHDSSSIGYGRTPGCFVRFGRIGCPGEGMGELPAMQKLIARSGAGDKGEWKLH